jgi:hypothetical protein
MTKKLAQIRVFMVCEYLMVKFLYSAYFIENKKTVVL